MKFTERKHFLIQLENAFKQLCLLHRFLITYCFQIISVIWQWQAKSIHCCDIVVHLYVGTTYIYILFGIVIGNWGVWGAWSTCSTTCGSGTWIRSISCGNPAPAHGGSDCTGNKHDTTQCFKPNAHVFMLLNTINLSPLKTTIHPE